MKCHLLSLMRLLSGTHTANCKYGEKDQSVAAPSLTKPNALRTVLNQAMSTKCESLANELEQTFRQILFLVVKLPSNGWYVGFPSTYLVAATLPSAR